MSDLLQTGLTWLHTQRAGYMTSTVTYRLRGAGAGASVSATVSQIRRESMDGDGFPVTVISVDFLIARTALAAEPAVGDVITFNGRTYQVGTDGDGDCWRWTDASRLAYRIHAREAAIV